MPTPFPTFALRNRQWTVEHEWQKEDFEAESGRVITTTYWTGSKRHWQITINGLRSGVAAPAPWAAYDEPGALRAVYAQMLGLTGNIAMIDPDGGPDVTVKFETPLRIIRLRNGLYRASIELVEDV